MKVIGKTSSVYASTATTVVVKLNNGVETIYGKFNKYDGLRSSYYANTRNRVSSI